MKIQPSRRMPDLLSETSHPATPDPVLSVAGVTS
jgi:hypothetical protein